MTRKTRGRSSLPRAARWQARWALAMLPLGALVAIGGVLAAVALAALALAQPLARGADWPWAALWATAAAAAALRVARGGVEAMSSFTARPLVPALAWTAAAVAACPWWWR